LCSSTPRREGLRGNEATLVCKRRLSRQRRRCSGGGCQSTLSPRRTSLALRLCSVLAVPSAASRCSSAAELLLMLEASLDPLFMWQQSDVASLKFVPVHPASSVFLEAALSANEPLTGLPLPPPLDLIFDIQAMPSSPSTFPKLKRKVTRHHTTRAPQY
jgi:hypothetical protein